MSLRLFFLLLPLVSWEAGAKDALKLKPFKDKLFFHRVMEKKFGGAFLKLEYSERRDVNGQDEIPVKKAKKERVDLSPLEHQSEIQVNFDGGSIETFEVGSPEKAKFAVIFIHGGGGDKSLGAADWTFGGNFNRLKNLAVLNQGVYYSPSVTFDEQGMKGVRAIMERVKAGSPDARIVVACGSAGGDVCWRLGNDPQAVKSLGGLLALGSASVPANFENSPAHAARVPILYAHGSRDSVLPWDVPYQQFLNLKNKGYPTRFLLVNRGNHGNPIRLIDWRNSLDWFFAQPAPKVSEEAKKTKKAETISEEAPEKTNVAPAK